MSEDEICYYSEREQNELCSRALAHYRRKYPGGLDPVPYFVQDGVDVYVLLWSKWQMVDGILEQRGANGYLYEVKSDKNPQFYEELCKKCMKIISESKCSVPCYKPEHPASSPISQ